MSGSLIPIESARRFTPGRPGRRTGAALLLLLGEACGTDGPAGPARVAELRFAAPADSMTSGDSRPLSLQLLDGEGRPLTGRAVSYQSSAPQIATVDAAGMIR